ncbi:DHA2 family efflux MFS transporter permease subunit [Pseudomonas benzenivorans]|uniref:DHA2 family efflux MFS transporter permease subunit n=1 Tax=Pseudomonas benzenivorans TaxID=556533 RepID=A0ABZ0Q0V7_9PSED|nr:DHA2 family efflux MFS transporter permease subunit [Pseudomonas benzenivorans]WPC06724.1 DHA2 family efflux MFS transporter permease subunit [Pseudomonas benzenivorans]
MAQDLHALQVRFGARYPQWLLGVLMLGSMAMVLASTTINVALPAIMVDFAIGRPLVQWLSTGFLAAMTAGLLLSAWAQARWGARRTAQIGLALFILTSLLAVVAQAAWQLIALRIVQGLCAGIVQPLAMVLIFRVFAVSGRGMALGIYGLGVMVAPTLGPSIGGYLVDHFGWPAVFWLPLPLCVLALLAGQWLLPSQRERTTPMLDVGAFALMCVALFAALGALAEAQRFAWGAPRVWLPAVIGAVALAGFFARSRRSGTPLLPLDLWRHAGFRSASWVALTLGVGLYGSTYLIPLYLQTIQGYSAGLAGALLLPTGVLMGAASFAGGWLSDRSSAALLLASGLLIFALSAAGLAWLEPGAPFVLLCFWACVGRVGLGLLLPALSTGSLDILSPQELAQGAGAVTFVRQLGGAFGVNLLTFFLEWRHAAEGGHGMAEALAFQQSFWLVAAVFVLTVLAAVGVRPSADQGAGVTRR